MYTSRSILSTGCQLPIQPFCPEAVLPHLSNNRTGQFFLPAYFLVINWILDHHTHLYFFFYLWCIFNNHVWRKLQLRSKSLFIAKHPQNIILWIIHRTYFISRLTKMESILINGSFQIFLSIANPFFLGTYPAI